MSPIGGRFLEERSFQHPLLIPNSGDRLKGTRDLVGEGSGHHFPEGTVIKATAQTGRFGLKRSSRRQQGGREWCRVVHGLFAKPTCTEDGQQENAVLSPRRAELSPGERQAAGAGAGRGGRAGEPGELQDRVTCVPWGGGGGNSPRCRLRGWGRRKARDRSWRNPLLCT